MNWNASANAGRLWQTPEDHLQELDFIRQRLESVRKCWTTTCINWNHATSAGTLPQMPEGYIQELDFTRQELEDHLQELDFIQ